MSNPAFVTTQWLAAHLGDPDLVVVDGTWHLPTLNRDALAEYKAAHIPGAAFFDIDAISDAGSSLPHMLPDPIVFSSAMRKLGIGDGMRLVVYDGAGLFSAPRVRWTLLAFGVRDVTILEGGMPKWLAEGRPTEDGVPYRRPRHFTARLDHGAVALVDDVRSALASGSAQVIDARSAERFAGSAPEPREGVRAGHMPGSLNVPFTMLTSEGGLKSPAELEQAFVHAGVDLDKPVITTCGSGVTAAILALALESTGRRVQGLYDGAWAQWGARDDLAVETGPGPKT